MATRVCPGETPQWHHVISTSPWATAPLERVLAEVATRLVGGPEAVLIIDDTALPKQGTHSVGVARQYCGALGQRAHCQVLVSLTLAHGEVPVPLALRLYLPEAWASDAVGRTPCVAGQPAWRTSNSRENWGSIISRAARGRGSITTRSSR
jgi:SRSO17 transposase